VPHLLIARSAPLQQTTPSTLQGRSGTKTKQRHDGTKSSFWSNAVFINARTGSLHHVFNPPEKDAFLLLGEICVIFAHVHVSSMHVMSGFYAPVSASLSAPLLAHSSLVETAPFWCLGLRQVLSPSSASPYKLISEYRNFTSVHP